MIRQTPMGVWSSARIAPSLFFVALRSQALAMREHSHAPQIFGFHRVASPRIVGQQAPKIGGRFLQIRSILEGGRRRNRPPSR
jgi:hypothetical protein